MKYIAHVFPTRAARTRHLNDVFCEDKATEVNKTLSRYSDHDGSRHYCFVVAERDDIADFLGFEFSSHELHGTFEHLSLDDVGFLKAMLRQRTRHVPEASVG